MAYATGNPPTKKALKERVASANPPTAYTPGGMFPDPRSTACTIEGPHFPKPHRWYARVQVDDAGTITKVLG